MRQATSNAPTGVIVSSGSTKPYVPPVALTVHQTLVARARMNPQAVAIAAPDRAALTYAALLAHITKTAGCLRSAGIRRNDRVAVVLPNGPEMATAFVAVASAATCAPLNPAYRASEFEFYMSDLGAKALVVSAGVPSAARDVAEHAGIPILELADTGGSAGEFDLSGGSAEQGVAADLALTEDTALVLHTSGTTSRPKIVPLSHTNISHSAHSVAATLALSAEDRCLNVMPLFHIHGLIAGLLASLTAGGSVICAPGFDPERFFQWLDTLQPTWYTAVPTIHQAVLSRAATHRDGLARQRLRFIRSSSASLPPAVMEDLEKTFGAPVIEAYGMTEAAHQMASNPLPPLSRKPGSVGLAAGPDVAVMDQAGQLLQSGQIGEIVIRGPNVTKGYENNPAANASGFTDGWFRTGDQGVIDSDGYLRLTGRLKEIINRGGEKIAPREVDDILAEHPAVEQAIAFAVPHPTLGEDVAAAVVLKPGAAVQEKALLEFAAARLAEFKVPKQLLIVDEIPKGPTGKLQRIGLAEKLEPQLAAKRQANFQVPVTPLETQLSEIWKGVLKIPEVGVRDSFFELGGDSLGLVIMLTEVDHRFHASVPVDDFLGAPTIETLATYLGEAEDPRSQAAVPARQSMVKPIRDSIVNGFKNRLLQFVALYAPGFKTTRVWLHRQRGVSIGRNVSIGLDALIETAYPQLVYIGDNATLGMRTTIIGHLRDSTSQARLMGRHTVRIEADAYIGPGVIILPNVTIGQGAVVSAGSVVSRSVPPHILVRGNPAVPVARCGVSLGGGVSYEEFIRALKPL